MKNLSLFSALIGVLITTVITASATETLSPSVISWSGPQLSAAKASLARGEPGLQPALHQLLTEANRLLKLRPASVMDKTKVGPSGDKHDYYSQAPYWWPDPSKPNGLPYLRKDGQVYPDSKVGTDSNAFAKTCNAVETLGLAYFFSGQAAYAEKAAQLTRVWFLDTATKMNPNLNFGQTNPGHDTGRGEGVLEARHLAGLIDGLALLAGSSAWTDTDAQALKSWFSEYYIWLTTSPIALQEKNAKNNHGSWYDAQLAHIALYLGKKEDAKAIAIEAQTNRIGRQIEPDGQQPFELARTKSLDYCIFNLQALSRLSTVAQHVGVDLWAYRTNDGRSLYSALNYLAPFADPSKPWGKKDIIQESRPHLLAIFAQVLTQDKKPELDAELTRLSTPANAGERWRLLWVRPYLEPTK